MNAQRRTAASKVLSIVEQAIADIEAVRDEEQDTFDNMPESFQNGERGEKAQEAISNLEEAITGLESARDAMSAVTEA